MQRKLLLGIVVVSIAVCTVLGLMLSGLLALKDIPEPEPIIGVVNIDTSVGYPGGDLSDEFVGILRTQPSVTITEFNTTYEANGSLYNGDIIGYIIMDNGFEFNVSARIPAFIPYYANLLERTLVAKKVNDAIGDFKIAFNLTANDIYLVWVFGP